LKHCKCFVDQGEHIHVHRFRFLLQRNGSVEILDAIVVLALVKQELTVVVVHIGGLFEVLHTPSESCHGRCDRTHLVLGHAKLDMGEDEVAIQVNRFLIVGGSLRELSFDEMELSSVIIDIGILGVLRQGVDEVFLGLVRCAWEN
jgi:hypothetical protein